LREPPLKHFFHNRQGDGFDFSGYGLARLCHLFVHPRFGFMAQLSDLLPGLGDQF
jgi:hypothetical protein